MNVKELKEMLNKYPDEMEVITSRYSDCCIVDEDQWGIVSAVPNDFWVMRAHLTMSKENKNKKKDYLYLDGN